MKSILNFIKSLFGWKQQQPVKQYSMLQYLPNDLGFEVLALINNHRIAIGLFPLALNELICGVCLNNNYRMMAANNFSHDGIVERLDEVKIICKASAAGENLAYNFNTAQAVFNAWIKSDSHRKNIESAKWTHFGFAVTKDPSGKNLYTNIFAKLN